MAPSAWPLGETVPGKTWDLQQGTWPAVCPAAPRASSRVHLEPRTGRRQAGELPEPDRGGGREKGAALRALGGWCRPTLCSVLEAVPRCW